MMSDKNREIHPDTVDYFFKKETEMMNNLFPLKILKKEK